ncbi:phosphotransferase family protein [Pseudonocardia phyllosphaerae]|uniref:phosphotransferase family protein n=1 Tax=Pseudonocardia phyllosphaerae TaxID=3390502 RepID=UPI00397BF7C2
MTTSARTPTPGADPGAVGTWLAGVLDDERWARCELSPLGAGRSNLTYRVLSPAGSVVLRRPPVGSVAETAHDMAREQRVIAALAGTDVPVPAVLAGHDGGTGGPTGSPAFVMELVDGVVPVDALPEGWATTPAERSRLGYALVDVLAALHAVDPEAVGLGDFGRPEGFTERQIRRWRRQWDAARTDSNSDSDSDSDSNSGSASASDSNSGSASGDGSGAAGAVDAATEAEVTRLADRLAQQLPTTQRHTIVHGDYRIDNCVFDAEDPGTIRAVLDWEMSTLGDPLTDLGLLLVYWRQAGDDAVWRDAQRLPSPTGLPGFPTRAELVAAYADRTGLDVAELPWYVAFGTFKLAVVLAGILFRVRAGAVPAEMAEGLDGAVGPLVALGHHVLDGGSF